MPEIAQPESVPPSVSVPLPVVESVPRSVKPPGPGLPESLLWLIGAMMFQLTGSLIGYCVVIIRELAARDFDLKQMQAAIQAATTVDSFLIILAVALVATLCFTVAGAVLRLGVRGFVRLGFQLPSGLQVLLIVCLVLPLQLICGEFFRAVQLVVPDTGLDKFLQDLKPAPLYALVVLVGLLPALWEELLCRGLIGRGLISRWGLIPGILITSVLFGVMHLNPAHALAVIPLGIALHFVYLTTRTLWGPMLLHFLNNAMSVVLLKQGVGEAGGSETGAALPLSMLTVSITVSVALLLLLWQTRTRFISESGAEWSAGYASLEVPPGELRGNLVRESPRGLLLICSAVCVAGFVGVICLLTSSGVLASK